MRQIGIFSVDATNVRSGSVAANALTFYMAFAAIISSQVREVGLFE
jgi:hypothetical protein